MIEIKSVIELKNIWAVCNGFLNWEDFVAPFRNNNSGIPEAILDELIEFAICNKSK